MNRRVRADVWLPIALAFAWWLALYPGLFGEDSLITLEEARSGRITVWFTAWWGLIVDALSLDTRAIPLVTLAGVTILAWSVRDWAAAIWPEGRARTWAITAMCATPLVGGLGIQLRHDAWMTAGFLFALSAITRAHGRGRLGAADIARFAAAAALIPTRHNGLVTLILAAVIGVAVLPDRKRFVAVCLTLAAAVFVISQSATRLIGQPYSIDPVQAVEWMMADVSCLAADPAVQLTDDEWRRIEPIASRQDWPQPVACRFVSPLLIAPSFQAAEVQSRILDLTRTWGSLAWRYPARFAYVHARRVNLFLPPFVGGIPQQTQTPFIHSTILPNNFGLEWAFPRVAEIARLPMRAWNALRAILANTAIWLMALAVIAWRMPDVRARLMPTIVMCVALELGLLATAPIAEGRYGLLILVTGQLAVLYVALVRTRQ